MDDKQAPIEARYDVEGLDELIITNPETVHLERLDEAEWWIGINLPNGALLRINIVGSITVGVDAPGIGDECGDELYEQPPELVKVVECPL